MFLYLDSKLHKGRSNVVATKDSLSVSPVPGVKAAGKGMSLGTKGGVIVGAKGPGSQADDDEGMAYASDDPKNALNISVPSKPTVNINVRAPKPGMKKSEQVFTRLSDVLKAMGGQEGQKGQATIDASAPKASPPTVTPAMDVGGAGAGVGMDVSSPTPTTTPASAPSTAQAPATPASAPSTAQAPATPAQAPATPAQAPATPAQAPATPEVASPASPAPESKAPAVTDHSGEVGSKDNWTPEQHKSFENLVGATKDYHGALHHAQEVHSDAGLKSIIDHGKESGLDVSSHQKQWSKEKKGAEDHFNNVATPAYYKAQREFATAHGLQSPAVVEGQSTTIHDHPEVKNWITEAHQEATTHDDFKGRMPDGTLHPNTPSVLETYGLQERPTEAPAPEATTEAPAPEAPAPEATTEAPAPEATTEAPAPEATTEAPATEAKETVSYEGLPSKFRKEDFRNKSPEDRASELEGHAEKLEDIVKKRRDAGEGPNSYKSFQDKAELARKVAAQVRGGAEDAPIESKPEYQSAVKPPEVTSDHSPTEEKDLEGHTLSGAKNADGKWHGEVTHKDKDGNLRKKVSYKDGDLHGSSEHYHSSGAVAVQENHKGGKLHGKQVVNNERGERISEKHFSHGTQVGDAVEYHDNGQIKSKGQWDRGKEVGRIEFGKDGRVKSKNGTLEDADISDAPDHDSHDLGDDRDQLPPLSDDIQKQQNKALHQQTTFSDHPHLSDAAEVISAVDAFTKKNKELLESGEYEAVDAPEEDGRQRREIKNSADGTTVAEEITDTVYGTKTHRHISPNGEEWSYQLDKDGNPYSAEYLNKNTGRKSIHGFDDAGKVTHARFYANGELVGKGHLDKDGNPTIEVHYDGRRPSRIYTHEEGHQGIPKDASLEELSNEDIERLQDLLDGDLRDASFLSEDAFSSPEKSQSSLVEMYKHYHPQSGTMVLDPSLDEEFYTGAVKHISDNKDDFNYVKDGDVYKIHGIRDPKTGRWAGTPHGVTRPQTKEMSEGNPIPQEQFEALPDHLKPLVADLPPMDAPPKRLVQVLENFFDELSASDFSKEVALGSALGALLADPNPASSIRMAYGGLVDAVAAMGTGHLAHKKRVQAIKDARGPDGRPRKAGNVDPQSWLGKRTLRKTDAAIKAATEVFDHDMAEEVLGDRTHWTSSRHRKFQKDVEKLKKLYEKDLATEVSGAKNRGAFDAALNKLLSHHRDMGAAEAGLYRPHTTPSEQDVMNTYNVYGLLGHMGGLSDKQIGALKKDALNWSSQTLREVRRLAYAGLKQRADKNSFDEAASILDTAHRVGKELNKTENQARREFNKYITTKDRRVAPRQKYKGAVEFSEDQVYIPQGTKEESFKRLMDLYGESGEDETPKKADTTDQLKAEDIEGEATTEAVETPEGEEVATTEAVETPEGEEVATGVVDEAKGDVLAAAGKVAKQDKEIEGVKESRKKDLPASIEHMESHPSHKDWGVSKDKNVYHWYGDQSISDIADMIKGASASIKKKLKNATLVVHDNPKEGEPKFSLVMEGGRLSNPKLEAMGLTPHKGGKSFSIKRKLDSAALEMLKEGTAFEDAFGMPLEEYSEKYSKDAHFRNQQINSGEFDANLKSLKESLKGMGWEPKGFPGKKSKPQESNAGAQRHVNDAVTEVLEETDITPGEMEEVQQLISDATGITHADPVEISEASVEDIKAGPNVYQIDFGSDEEALALEKKRPRSAKGKQNLEAQKKQLAERQAANLQATLSKYGEDIESVTDVGNGLYVINFSNKASDKSKNDIIENEDLEKFKVKKAARGPSPQVVPAPEPEKPLTEKITELQEAVEKEPLMVGEEDLSDIDPKLVQAPQAKLDEIRERLSNAVQGAEGAIQKDLEKEIHKIDRITEARKKEEETPEVEEVDTTETVETPEGEEVDTSETVETPSMVDVGKVIRRIGMGNKRAIQRAQDPQATLDKLKREFGEGGSRLEKELAKVSPDQHDRVKAAVQANLKSHEKLVEDILEERKAEEAIADREAKGAEQDSKSPGSEEEEFVSEEREETPDEQAQRLAGGGTKPQTEELLTPEEGEVEEDVVALTGEGSKDKAPSPTKQSLEDKIRDTTKTISSELGKKGDLGDEDRIKHLESEIKKYHTDDSLDSDFKEGIKEKLNDLLGKEQIAQRAAAGDIEKVTVAKEEEGPSPVRQTREELEAAIEKRKKQKQADVEEQKQRAIDQEFDKSKALVSQYRRQYDTAVSDLPSAEEKFLVSKLDTIMRKPALYEKWSSELDKIENDPEYAELDSQEQQFLAAERVNLPKSVENQLKNSVVEWAKKLSTQQREDKALFRRQQKRARELSQEQVRGEEVPEGATVEEGGKDIPVKPISEAENEDDVSRFFRHKYENDPKYKKAFEALIGPQLKEDIGKYKTLLSNQDKLFKKAQKDLDKGTISQQEFDRIERNSQALNKLADGGEVRVPGGKLVLDGDKVYSIQRDTNNALKTIASARDDQDIPPEMFLYERKGTAKEWDRFERAYSLVKPKGEGVPLNPSDYDDKGLINNLKALKKRANDDLKAGKISQEEYDSRGLPPKGARLSSEARRQWFRDRYTKWETNKLPQLREELEAAYDAISDKAEWKSQFKDKKVRDQALKLIKELHQSWPDEHTPQAPKGGFYLGDTSEAKVVAEEVKDLDAALRRAEVKLDADEVSDGLSQVATRILQEKMGTNLGTEDFTKWYERIAKEKDRLPGIDKDIQKDSAAYKDAARDLYPAYLVGDGKDHPTWGVPRPKFEAAKSSFIKTVKEKLSPLLQKEGDSKEVEKVLSDKYLGNIFDKYTEENIKNIERNLEFERDVADRKSKRSESAKESNAKIKENTAKSQKAVKEHFNKLSEKAKKAFIEDLIVFHGHGDEKGSGGTSHRITPSNKELSLFHKLFPSRGNEKRYEDALGVLEVDSSKPVEVGIEPTAYHRNKVIAPLLWDEVSKLEDAGKNDEASELVRRLEVGGVNEPYASKKKRESDGKTHYRLDSHEARAAAFGDGGSFRDDYIPEGKNTPQWKTFEVEGLNPLVEKISKRFGVPEDRVKELLPDHQDVSFSKTQYRHLEEGLKKLADGSRLKGTQKARNKDFATAIAKVVQSHRDGFHPYVHTSLRDLAGLAPKQLAASEEWRNKLLSPKEAKELAKLVSERTGKSKDQKVGATELLQAKMRVAGAKEQKLVEKMLQNWLLREEVQAYKEKDATHRGKWSGYEPGDKAKYNKILSELGIDDKNLIKSLMAQFGVDKYRAFEMLKSMEASMSNRSLYLDSTLFKADFLSWPQSKRAYNNSFNRLRTGVGPEGTPSFETDKEQREEAREYYKEKREDRDESEDRDETTEKSFRLYVSV